MRYAVLMVAMLAAGCGAFAVRPGDYRVAGTTTSPEAMVRAAADAYAETSEADTRARVTQWAIEHGVSPWAAAYGATDMDFFYGGMVQPQVAAPQGYIEGGEQPATVEQVAIVADQAAEADRRAQEAHDRATDALRGLRGHQQWLQQHAGQH